ncbi:MAG: DUF389 domain-containing protein [Anaerolineales bacterium]|nr:DUF389 domain-containing protein [Anaerolineales bacterium]
MSFPEEPPTPHAEPQPEAEQPRPRRRRPTRRSMLPTDQAGQAEFIHELAKRAFPSVELFVFALACGAIMGLGFLLDSQAVLLLGILLTPLMLPWVGFLLAILTGSARFLFETSMALLISAILVFIGGVATGFCIRFFPPYTQTNLYAHTWLWLPELVVLAIGAVTLVASFIRSENKPFLPSVIIAYSFFLPVSAAGFGLGAGLPGVWPRGLFVAIVHLALASLLGLLTLFVMRLRPTAKGYAFSGVALATFAAILIFLMNPGRASSAPPTATQFTPTNLPTSTLPALTPSLPASPTNSPAPTQSPTRAARTETLTVTPKIESPTPTSTATATIAVTNTATPLSVTPVPLTLTITLPASETPTVTLTLEIQPISGKISASEGGGANLRQTPNGKYLMTLDNGTFVDIYPDFKIVNGVTWIHVFVTRNNQRIEGWLLESVVTYSTPEPNFAPTATPSIGITPSP